MKKYILLFTAICLCVSAAAQSVPSLLIPTDSRSLAMGGVTRPLTANYSLDAQGSFGIWAPQAIKSTVIGADVALCLGRSILITLEGKSFLDTPYEESGDQGKVKDSFQPYDFNIALGGAYFFNDWFYAGLKLRSVTSVLSSKGKGSAFCGDIFAGYGAEKWSVAVAGRNIGSKINYGSGDWSLPALAAISSEFRPLEGLKADAEVDYLFSGALMAGIGVEYGFADMVFARAGFHYGDQAKALPTFASAGIGAKFIGIRLDASMIFLSKTLGNSFLVSLGYSF
jgi:hypothetical protein